MCIRCIRIKWICLLHLKRRCLHSKIVCWILYQWVSIFHCFEGRSVLGPLLFLIYINNLPKFVNGISVPILFADDTSILVSHPNSVEFYNTIITDFQTLSNWFQNNLLSLNITKTNFIRFVTKKNNYNEKTLNMIISYFRRPTLQNFLV